MRSGLLPFAFIGTTQNNLVGRKIMPLREHALLCPPILEYLRGGKRPSWEIENELAWRFNICARITSSKSALKTPSGNDRSTVSLV
jgi:hypothetical protein